MSSLSPYYVSEIVIGARRDRHCYHSTDGKTKQKSDFLRTIQNGNSFQISDIWPLVYKKHFVSEYYHA